MILKESKRGKRGRKTKPFGVGEEGELLKQKGGWTTTKGSPHE